MLVVEGDRLCLSAFPLVDGFCPSWPRPSLGELPLLPLRPSGYHRPHSLTPQAYTEKKYLEQQAQQKSAQLSLAAADYKAVAQDMDTVSQGEGGRWVGCRAWAEWGSRLRQGAGLGWAGEHLV